MSAVLAKAAGRLRDRWCAWARLAASLPRAGVPLLVLASLVALVCGLLPITFIVSMGYVLSELAAAPGADGADALRALSGTLALALGAFALQQLLGPLQAILTDLIRRRLDGAGIAEVMSSAIRAPLARTEQQETITRLTTTTVNFLYLGLTAGRGAAALLPMITRYVDLIAAVVVIGVTISWLVAILLALAALVIRFARRGSLGRYSRMWSALRGDRQKLFYLQSIGIDDESAKEMRALRLAPWLTERHQRDSQAYLDPLWSGRRRLYFAPFIRYSVFGWSVAALAFAAIAWQTSGEAEVLGLAVAVQAVLVPLRFGANFMDSDTETQYGLQAATDLADLHRDLAGPPEEPRRRLALSAPPTIRFEKVTFAYPDSDHTVLSGMDLTLPSGTATAVVGMNGAGKTTLVKQLCGLYVPSAGRITVEGQDLRGIDLPDWRRHVAVILQDFVQYETTLRDNVFFGAPGYPLDEEALSDAIERAGARGIVEGLSAGLDTILSPAYEGGVGLSGGQWQRLALARALYAVNMGARLLVLDEPTAQLDVRSEAAFFDQFLNLTEGLTTLVISHRFSTVRRASAIAVLADGRVTEYGGHDELMDLDGTYAEMFRLQADRFTDDVPADIAAAARKDGA
ncbi:ABC transporter ATP-binding protein [Nocardia sp. NPDC050435]|uniref:ABC transporter ATP-binding protein n=1 Tax=Nocardia sp. NPDC050435 TaxID=3155040 RepID=UPI0033C4A833